MSRRRTTVFLLNATFAAVLMGVAPLSAAPSTSRGQISVAQVMEMLEKAPTEKAAQQVLTAYLAGVGETASMVAGTGGALPIGCKSVLTLNDRNVRQALAASGNVSAETAATPLIVRDMLSRAGCNFSK
jgi:hypothetical protein